MANVTGGLRRRLIKDNLYYMLEDSLRQLGWFNGALSRQSVTLVAEQIDARTEIKPNVIGISAEDLLSENIELGSNLDEYTWSIFIDIFAESEAVGTHLSGDIYDILNGKISSIGRTGPDFAVKDLMTEEQPFLFNCYIDGIEVARVREWEKPHMKYWWIVACDLVDTYYGE